ncbi:hypothetical protein B0H11DRAFT_2065774 [Mycena galericulata]|nr:hypothetical protein B0H11DRAFT_2065774 [Mycena galericulata]
MHLVSLSSRQHRQNSSIVPVRDIVRSCHLIPVYGKAVNRTWTSASNYDFYLFRYLVAMYARRKVVLIVDHCNVSWPWKTELSRPAL